jgi:hypothetical protein
MSSLINFTSVDGNDVLVIAVCYHAGVECISDLRIKSVG